MPIIRYWAFKNKLKRLNKIPYLVQNLDASEGGYFHKIIPMNLTNFLPAQETIPKKYLTLFRKIFQV